MVKTKLPHPPNQLLLGHSSTLFTDTTMLLSMALISSHRHTHTYWTKINSICKQQRNSAKSATQYGIEYVGLKSFLFMMCAKFQPFMDMLSNFLYLFTWNVFVFFLSMCFFLFSPSRFFFHIGKPGRAHQIQTHTHTHKNTASIWLTQRIDDRIKQSQLTILNNFGFAWTIWFSRY